MHIQGSCFQSFHKRFTLPTNKNINILPTDMCVCVGIKCLISSLYTNKLCLKQRHRDRQRANERARVRDRQRNAKTS